MLKLVAKNGVCRGLLYAFLLCASTTTGCSAPSGEAGAAGDPAVELASAALSAPPEPTGCTSATSGARQYWFCTPDRTWSVARQKCTAVGLDLASIESSTENGFIRGRLLADSWAGGSDQAIENTWRWIATNAHFWQGASNGTPVAGSYTNWDLLQPNSSSQDCLEVDRLSGKWSDESCSNARDYVCEGPLDLCPQDPLKDAPGQCGCGNPDTDTDGDGTADCIDQCVGDPGKTVPGTCGCGEADTDTDHDGVADCTDGCDEDRARTVPPCSPDNDCQLYHFGGSDYFFCDNHRNYSTASSRCDAVGMSLVRIDSAAENSFVASHIITDRWIGATDITTEGTWVWGSGGDQFWSGGALGSPVGGLFSRWGFGEPNNALNQDCAQVDFDGRWNDDSCNDNEQYICETAAYADNDCDGINDLKERTAGLNPSVPDGEIDADGDDVPNADELRFGGDPFDTDTDNDSVLDTTDLLTGTDLDGDADPYQSDNCPWDVNPAQSDADGDGRGDSCDDAPAGTLQAVFQPFWVTRHTDTRSWAIVPASDVDAQRSYTDRRGQLQTGISFRMPSELSTGTSAVFELYNPSTGAHAYPNNAVERDALIASGFESRGVIGAVSATAYAFGTPAQLRRFVKGSGSARQEAITVDGGQASELTAAGYAEVTAVGWVQADQGRYVNPEGIVRYVAPSSGAYTHSRLRGAEVDVIGSDSDGIVFRVFPGKLGGAKPIYRLRAPSGAEVLTSSETERSTLKAQNHAEEGVIGYGMVDASASARIKLPLVGLVRFDKAGSPARFSASADEQATLIASGYTATSVVAFVVPATQKQRDERACLGAPSALDEATAMFAGEPAEIQPALYLLAMATSCLVQRALTGEASSEAELLLAQFLGTNPDAETIEEVLRRFNIWQELTAAERATLLGDLASLDPADCSDPVPIEEIQDVIREALGLGDLNVNNYTLRSFQCGGGPGVGARDVTVVGTQFHCLASCTPAFCEFCDAQEQSFAPYPYGVLPSEGVAFGVPGKTCASTDPDDCTPGALIENWGHAHPNLGLPLIGIDTGEPCPCNATLGQYCVNGSCRAYPIIDDNTNLTFTGAGFWDRQGLVRFKPVDSPNVATATFNTIVTPYLEAPPANNDARCDVSLTPWVENIQSPSDPCNGPCVQPLPVPEEKWRDLVQIAPGENKGTLFGSLELDAGRFYEVEFVNQNGDYFVFGEPIPADPAAARALARTIHVCQGADPAHPENGSCDLVAIPDGSELDYGLDPSVASCLDANGGVVECSASVGGVWRSPPCAQPGGCPETPLEFPSATTVDGQRLMVFVGNSNAEQFANAKLSAVECLDETGWDAGGEDELVVLVWAGTNNFNSEDFDAEDVMRSANAVSFGIDSRSNERSNSRKFNRGDESWMASVPLPVRAESGLQSSGGVIVIEEDDRGPAAIVATIGFAIGTAAATYVNPWLGAGVGLVGGSVVTAILTTGPDDFIGSRQWTLSVDALSVRGQRAHVSDPSTKPVPLLHEEAASHVAERVPLDHAAVDGDLLDTNPELNGSGMSCTTSRDCDHLGAGRCAMNVCVGFSTCTLDSDCFALRKCRGGFCLPPPRAADGSCFADVNGDGANDQDVCWDDHTVAPTAAAPVLAGHTEFQRFNGSGTNYRVYTAHSMSEKDASRVGH